jgi:hypothetical protein
VGEEGEMGGGVDLSCIHYHCACSRQFFSRSVRVMRFNVRD